MVNIRQHEAPNYTYSERKKILLFIPYKAFYVLCWTCMSPRSLLIKLNALCCFFIVPDFRYTHSRNHSSWRSYYETISLLAWYVSCVWELFSVNLIVFATYVKNSWCLKEAAVWEIVVCSTCRKQSEYFGQGDVARFLICYIYNGVSCHSGLRLDPTDSYYYKELYHRPGRATKVYFFC